MMRPAINFIVYLRDLINQETECENKAQRRSIKNITRLCLLQLAFYNTMRTKWNSQEVSPTR